MEEILDSYEVEYEGHKYFGNVSLREFHIFDYDGNVYLVNVGELIAKRISSKLATEINRIALGSCHLVPESIMEKLRALNLVCSEENAALESELGICPWETKYPVVNIALFLAQECNMRCVYCYGNAGKYAGSGMISKETAFRAIDWLIENSGNEKQVNIGFFGGEPLLNFPLMCQIVPYARQQAEKYSKHVSFGITTNGSLLTDEIIKFIKSENIKPLISFDGPPEYQNRQRPFKDGSESYDRVNANIQKLRAVLPSLTGRATVYGDGDPFRVKEGMKQVGFTTSRLTPASPVLINANTTPSPEHLDERMLERMLMFNRKEIDELHSAILLRNIDSNCPPIFLLTMGAIALKERKYYGCGIGKGMVGISVTGDIYPCQSFVGLKELRLGNITDYRAGKLNEYYRSVVDHLPECQNCWARYHCGGGCFYHNMAHTGDMRRPAPLICREKKAIFEGVIHVYCQLDEADREYARGILRALRVVKLHS